jgi:hypothetical protein
MRVPLWLKLAYHIWLLGWLVSAAKSYPYPHFLWMCYLGNVVVGLALWTENRLLFSWQCCSLFFVDCFWTFDVVAQAISFYSAKWGHEIFHYKAMFGTGYMFDPDIDDFRKIISLFHMLMPFLFGWGLLRFGYDRRAIWLQLATCAILYPLTYWISLSFGNLEENKIDNINWVFGLFGKQQHTIPELQMLFVALMLYPIVMYIPANFLLILIFGRARWPSRGTTAPGLSRSKEKIPVFSRTS